jgi:hypothetical protein
VGCERGDDGVQVRSSELEVPAPGPPNLYGLLPSLSFLSAQPREKRGWTTFTASRVLDILPTPLDYDFLRTFFRVSRHRDEMRREMESGEAA